MKKRSLPASSRVALIVFFICNIVNALNLMLLNPPLEWLTWITNILIVATAIILVYNAVKLIRNRIINKQK